MTPTLTESTPSTPTRPTAPRRAGYVVAVIANAVLLYLAHHLLEWEWPRFLTPEFDDVLPIVTVSLIASIAANLVYLWYDSPWFKSLTTIGTSAIGFVAALRLLRVFPFDFSDYATNWSWLVRFVLVVALIGSVIGIAAESLRLISIGTRGSDR